MSRVYAVTGASGNTGGVVAEELLKDGYTVRVIARNKEKLQKFDGAEVYDGDLFDTEFLSNAFNGADAAYVMIPPNLDSENIRDYQNKAADSIVEAVQKSGVKNVVALSSIGADLDEGTGIILGLHDFEEKLKKLDDVNILFLRAGYFMENTLPQAGIIKKYGTMGAPVKAEKKFPAVASHDIGNAAAEELKKLDFSGISHQYVLGKEDVSYNEIAEVYGKEIGKEDLAYIQYPYDEFHRAMVGMGASQDVATAYVGLAQAMNEGKLKYDRNEKSTTQTSIKDFAKTFKEVYNS